MISKETQERLTSQPCTGKYPIDALKFPDLILAVHHCYFEQMLSGDKKREYRQICPYWIKRLEGKTFNRVIIIDGWIAGPGARLIYTWKGYEVTTLDPEGDEELNRIFGNLKIPVYAIIIDDEKPGYVPKRS